MAQFTSSKTTGSGTIVNTVLDTVSNQVTYTVTTADGYTATATQNSVGGVGGSTSASLKLQLAQAGADAQTFSIGLNTALSQTTSSVSEQAVAAPPGAQETAPIPVPTVADPQVPQPTNNTPSATTSDTATSVDTGTDTGLSPYGEQNDPPAATKEAAAVDPTQDEFGNLDAAQAAAADSAVPVTQEDIDAGLDEALAANATDEEDNAPRVYGPADLGVEEEGFFGGLVSSTSQFINRATLGDGDAINAASQAATITKAKEQATLAARYKSPANADWRVRLILPENANYLYKANPPGILKPLAQSNGVVFPYTPQIQTNYSANYEQYDLVHSNYRGYFYKNSKVGDISINATFTAQDTQEAEYLLAVIHFFRSATKMFYGQDAQRGAPPPMVYLVGYGDYQFNGHPCLISNFQYNLPSDVDYIRANNPNNYGTNMLNRVSASTSTSNIVPASVNRLANAIDNFGRSLKLGALSSVPIPGTVPGSVSNLNRSTYVPTKIEINITLLPVQTRAQVSKQFSVKGFANGDLLKGGFW